MLALPWTLSGPALLGYGMALSYGHLGWFADLRRVVADGRFAARQTQRLWLRCLGHGLFIFLALALALHWLPGFYNGRAIAPSASPTTPCRFRCT
jgi:hypothetical protein